MGWKKGWKDGVESIWETENRYETPFAMQTLHRSGINDNVQSHDVEEDHVVNDLHLCKYAVNGKRISSKMPLLIIKNRLIEYFEMCFSKLSRSSIATQTIT